MDIFKVRGQEMMDIIDFYYYIEDYGHYFIGENEELDQGFKEINSGIEKIYELVKDHYGR